MHALTKHRKEIFKEILEHIKNNPEINDILIGGDCNQCINDNEIKRFHEQIDAYEMHSIVNEVPTQSIGKTCKNGSRTIDSLAATTGSMEHVEGCKLLGYDDVVESDHRSYLIEIAMEDYFNEQLSE